MKLKTAAIDEIMRITMEARMLRVLGDIVAPLDPVLARVWLLGPGDQCSSCPMSGECPDHTNCLHLVASAGISSRLDGPFRRYPIGHGDVGRVFLERRALVAHRDLDRLGLAETFWLAL